jgi:3-phytase
MRRFIYQIIFLLTVAGLSQAQVVHPVASTSQTPDSADDPSIWIHPTDASKSVIIGTDKSAGIYVWDMNGNEVQHLPQGTSCNNIDLRYDIQLGGQSVDIVAANLRNSGKLAVFKLNPNYTNGDVLVQIADRNSSNNNIQRNSYGLALYRRPSDGSLYVFEKPEDNGGEVRQYLIEDDGTGNGVTLTAVRDLNYSGDQAEGFVADDELGFIYITEEAEGIHKYYADPQMSSDRILFFASGDGINGDREGLAIYACDNGGGYLLLSSQGNSTIKIYDRQGNNQFIKTVEPRDQNGDGDLGTDGLDVTSFAAPPTFSQGLVVVHDDGGRRFHIYDWADFAQDDLGICVNGSPTAVEEDESAFLPSRIELEQNYPNPFNPSTTISYHLTNSTEGTLAIYNLRGELVRTLAAGALAAGSHRVVWNGVDENGQAVASGIYIYRLQADGVVASRKLVFTK